MVKVSKFKWVEEEVPRTLAGFRKWEFTSEITAGEDFKVFAKLFRKEISRQLPSVNANLIKFRVGHYYISGFAEAGGKFVYFSIPDVRFRPGGWLTDILIRTARSAEDYTGGCNHYVSLEEFGTAVAKLLSA
jgi:hypothetical protein